MAQETGHRKSASSSGVRSSGNRGSLSINVSGHGNGHGNGSGHRQRHSEQLDRSQLSRIKASHNGNWKEGSSNVDVNVSNGHGRYFHSSSNLLANGHNGHNGHNGDSGYSGYSGYGGYSGPNDKMADSVGMRSRDLAEQYKTRLNIPDAATMSRSGPNTNTNTGRVSPSPTGSDSNGLHSYCERASYRKGLLNHPVTWTDLQTIESDIDNYLNAMKSSVGDQPQQNGLIGERDVALIHENVMKQFKPKTPRALRPYLFYRIAGIESQHDPLPTSIREASELGKFIVANEGAARWYNLKIFGQECETKKLKKYLDESNDVNAQRGFDMAYCEVKKGYEEKAIVFGKYKQESFSDLRLFETLYIDPMKDRLRKDNIMFSCLKNLGCNVDDMMKKCPATRSVVMETATPLPKQLQKRHKRQSSMNSGLLTATQLSKNDIGKLDYSQIEVMRDEIMENLRHQLEHYQSEIETRKRLSNEQSAKALDARIDDWIDKAKLLCWRKCEIEEKGEFLDSKEGKLKLEKEKEEFDKAIAQFEAQKATIFEKHRKLSLTAPNWSDILEKTNKNNMQFPDTIKVSVQREIDRQSIHFENTLIYFFTDLVKHYGTVQNLHLSEPRDLRSDLSVVREMLQQASLFIKENNNHGPGSYTFELRSTYHRFRKINQTESKLNSLENREYSKQLSKMKCVYDYAIEQFNSIRDEISENVIRFNELVRGKTERAIEVPFRKAQSVTTKQRIDKQNASRRRNELSKEREKAREKEKEKENEKENENEIENEMGNGNGNGNSSTDSFDCRIFVSKESIPSSEPNDFIQRYLWVSYQESRFMIFENHSHFQVGLNPMIEGSSDPQNWKWGQAKNVSVARKGGAPRNIIGFEFILTYFVGTTRKCLKAVVEESLKRSLAQYVRCGYNLAEPKKLSRSQSVASVHCDRDRHTNPSKNA